LTASTQRLPPAAASYGRQYKAKLDGPYAQVLFALFIHLFPQPILWQLSSRNLKTKPSSSSGASSGIELGTARLAAKAGAKLVLAARSEDALRHLTD
jgi:hypothetical protein